MTVGSLLTTLQDLPEGTGFPYFKVKTDVNHTLRVLVSMDKGRGGQVHNVRVGGRYMGSFTCTGQADCPGCQAGNKPNYRGWLIVWNSEAEGGGRVEILSGGKRMMTALAAIHTAYGDVRFRDVVMKRTGEKFDTQYVAYPRVKSTQMAELMMKFGDDVVVDQLEILLSGDKSIGSEPISAEVAKKIAEQFKLEEWDGEDIFEAINEKAQEILDRVSAPVSVEKMEAMLAGRKPNEEKTEKTDEAKDDDFNI